MTLLDFNHAKRQGELARDGLNAEDIRQRLHANPRAFIEWLYSGRAYYSKNEARIGNVMGEQGSSLSIDLSNGLWKDHATDEGGDLISLYRTWRGYSGDANFVLSLKEIAHDFLGDPIEIDRPAWTPTPTHKIAEQKAKLGDKPREENLQLGAPVATYRYFDLHGKIQASVVRFEPDGTRESKTFRPWCYKIVDGREKWVMGTPDIRPLYRLPEIATHPFVVLCEGEGCADALASIGIPATSAMQGAKAPIDKTDWSPLVGKTVIVWPDNDAPGLDYGRRVSERLAALGCTVKGVTPPSDVPLKWDAADCVAEGKNAHALIERAAEIASSAKPRVRVLKVSEFLNAPPPVFLIKDIITENGLSMVWGRSGSYKSFVALDMALCLATGMAWHGRDVKQGPVVYLAAEGARGLAQRANGWIKTRGKHLPEPDFRIIPHALTLANPDDLNALIAAIKDIKPVLIVIDTLSRTFGTGNPNQPSDMNAFVAACDRLREETGAHVMVVHHAGKDTDKGEVGNEGLRNASDTVIHVRRRTTTIELINEAPKGKQKDYEEFKTIKLEPRQIEIPDSDQTTVILNEHIPLQPTMEDGSDEPDGPPEQKLGKLEKLILEALQIAGQPLGLVRLAALTGSDNTPVNRAADKLVVKGLAERADDGNGDRKLWKVKTSTLRSGDSGD